MTPRIIIPKGKIVPYTRCPACNVVLVAELSGFDVTDNYEEIRLKKP